MSLLLLFAGSGSTPTPDPDPVVPTTLSVTGKPFLAWGNLADGVTLSGGAWTAGLPLNNLKTRLQARVARTTSAATAATKFDVDIGSTSLWRVFALAAHNFSLDALYRVRASSDPTFATWSFDTGWLAVWPRVYNTIDLPFEAENWWTGQYTAAERKGINPLLTVLSADLRSERYIRVEIDDTSNVNSFVQIGRLFIANGWTPSHHLTVGAEFGLLPRSNVQQSLGGQKFFDQRMDPRTAKFTLTNLPDDEGYSYAFEIMRQASTWGEVLFMWNQTDTLNALRRTMLCTQTQLDGIKHPYSINVSAAFALEELL